MNESEGDERDNRGIETGDVMMMKASVLSFILLVTSNADAVDAEYGAKMAICWLEHPDPTMAGKAEWMWERSLEVAGVWQKIAHAK